jgi:hypothetical protein
MMNLKRGSQCVVAQMLLATRQFFFLETLRALYCGHRSLYLKSLDYKAMVYVV